MSCGRRGETCTERGANYLVLSTVPCARCRPLAHLKHSMRFEWWVRTRFMDRTDWIILAVLTVAALGVTWGIVG